VLERATRRAAILHTHMQAQYGLRTYARVRRHQWAQLTQRAFSALASASFVCAAGDLNTMPTEGVFTSYGRYWQDLSAPLRQAGVRSTTIQRADEWIDYVLALAPTATRIRSCSLSLLDARDSFGVISDHHGLVASFELQPSGSPPSLRALAPEQHLYGVEPAPRLR
jgi:endonuclease/exonuclease/phosphatase family metal-dependent hydrolase